MSQSAVQYPPPERGIFTNRTLNLRGIRAIGYDMDYTLLHYRVLDWEQHAYNHLQQKFVAKGWPVEDLRFDAERVIRGLVLDLELGNIVKPNRFGYVKQAYHGTRQLTHEEKHAAYARTTIDLAEDRFIFANTLFSTCELCMYAQLVDLLDARQVPEVMMGYRELYRAVKRTLDEAHMEGQLKAEIVANPDRFVDLDPETPLALLDQRHAGKKLLLITNSEWSYSRPMMSYAFDRFLPKGMSWQDLFDVIIVSARKPGFFIHQNPLFEVVDDDGLLRPVIGGLREHGVFLGGNAALVEEYLGLSGDELLYVGDHIYDDVHVSKRVLRWRTALVLRELEQDMAALRRFAPSQRELAQLMAEKEQLEYAHCQARVRALRLQHKYGPEQPSNGSPVKQELQAFRGQLQDLDDRIAPLARAASELNNKRWGLLMRTGNDKSHLARQIERYADIYTSRVSNFLFQSPYVYLRSPRGSLPHDPGPAYLDTPDAG